MSTLSHINRRSEANMVDISTKAPSTRIAVAEGFVSMQPATLALIIEGGQAKGDVFATARIAGIQTAKKCADLIPLCHSLALTHIDVQLTPELELQRVNIQTRCKLSGKTGVEIEALTATTVAALTLYDMCKAVDNSMSINDIRVLEKHGGGRGNQRTHTANPKPTRPQSPLC